jgi:hypothetical protein
MELIRSIATVHQGNSVFAGVGERTREGTQLYREMLESGVMKDTVMVFGQMNEPSGVRLRVALTALAMAEYFRDQGRDVLLFIDNIFRFTMSGSEVSALLGPHALGGRLPAHPGDRNGRAARAHHLHPQRLDHLDAGGLRAGGRLLRPGPGGDLYPPGCDHRPRPLHRRKIDFPGGRPADLHLAHPRPATSWAKSTTTPRAKCSACCSATKTCRTSSPSSALTS